MNGSGVRYDDARVGATFSSTLTVTETHLVLGAGLSLAGKMVADKLGVPHVFCHYSLSVMRSRHYPPAVIPVFGLPRLGNEVLWRITGALFDATLGRAVNRMRRDAGLTPGTDVADAGFDDIPTVRDVTPALTTVRVPLEEIGRRALRLALGDPDAADAGAVRTEVVLRESTPPRR